MSKQWYIVHTYSGFEKKVKESLEGRVAAFGLTDKIGQIVIPTESVVEVRGGKKVISPRMCYPGYVLVEMDMDDYTWHVVRSTPRVTGFVGSGQTPNRGPTTGTTTPQFAPQGRVRTLSRAGGNVANQINRLEDRK